MTSIWTEFLKLKKDSDLTGNGVNHPNDFGHRVYAQVIATLLDPRGEPDPSPVPDIAVKSGPLNFTERRLLGNYTYSYACAAHDLDADGDLDLTTAHAEPNSNVYLLQNDGRANFKHSFAPGVLEQIHFLARGHIERQILVDVGGFHVHGSIDVVQRSMHRFGMVVQSGKPFLDREQASSGCGVRVRLARGV